MMDRKSVAAITPLAEPKVTLRLIGMRHETAIWWVQFLDHPVFAAIQERVDRTTHSL
jgi:hypothetical protein